MSNVTKELNDATTRIKPMLAYVNEIVKDFTARNNVIPKNDYQTKTILFKEINTKIAQQATAFEKEIALMKDKEHLSNLTKQLESTLVSMNTILTRTRPYATRYQQYVTEVNVTKNNTVIFIIYYLQYKIRLSIRQHKYPHQGIYFAFFFRFFF